MDSQIDSFRIGSDRVTLVRGPESDTYPIRGCMRLEFAWLSACSRVLSAVIMFKVKILALIVKLYVLQLRFG